MENQFLCDICRTDYEQYLRQAILFSTKINVMYPDISYPRPVDQEHMIKITSSLKQYSNFNNVNIVPMKGKSNRFVDFEHNPILFDAICRELRLTEVEKNCFRNRSINHVCHKSRKDDKLNSKYQCTKHSIRAN